MKVNEYKNELLGESVFCVKMPCGLEIQVMPKAGYNSAYALFAVKYGSIDTSIPDENGEYKQIPEGTAHFLEHKLFESEDLDAFERFAKTGANANAYTSFEQTAYLFRGSDKIYESLDILLDFVQSPYFTPQTIEKEQGIIGQEILMYKDVPDWEVMFNLLKALYKEHPVRIDIAGTKESIAQIDDKLLYSLYETYYNPSNMVLTIAGAVDPKEVFDFVSSRIKRDKKEVPKRQFIKEAGTPVTDRIEETLAIQQKQFLLGFKEELKKPEISLEKETASELLLEIICGKSSPLFRDMLESGLIDMSFGSEYFSGYGYSTFMFGGCSDKPDEAAKCIKKEIKRLKKEGIDEAAFERARKKMYGRLVMSYNDIDDIANQLASLYFCGDKPFDEIEVCKNITLEKVTARLKVLNEKFSAISIINPQEQGE